MQETNKQDSPIFNRVTVYAQKCPVCNGFGTLKYGSLVCHACNSKGYILVHDQVDLETERLEGKNEP